jgi:hypothetical protein
VRKRTIVIIISLISAFILMSGGYGSWQKPLFITGRIKVIEPPPPPVIEVVPINAEILEPNKPVTVDPEVMNKPGENETKELLPVEVIDAIDNPQDTDSVPINQLGNNEENNSENIVNTEQEQEQAVSEAIDGENTQEIALPTLEAADEVNGNTTEDQKSE